PEPRREGRESRTILEDVKAWEAGNIGPRDRRGAAGIRGRGAESTASPPISRSSIAPGTFGDHRQPLRADHRRRLRHSRRASGSGQGGIDFATPRLSPPAKFESRKGRPRSSLAAFKNGGG